MAEKEATVFIIDLGQTMGQRHQGRDQSDLDWAMTYVWEKITSIVLASRLYRKTLTKVIRWLLTERLHIKASLVYAHQVIMDI